MSSKRILLLKGLATATAALLAVGVAAAGYIRYGWFRTRPTPLAVEIAPGVDYERRILSDPRPAVVHLLAVDLANPRIRFWSTPVDSADSEQPFLARTTLQAAEQFGLLAAINGDHFGPFHAASPFDYYPHVGDRVAARGPSVAGGIPASPKVFGYFAKRKCTLSIGGRGAVLGDLQLNATTAISGGPILVRQGRVAECTALAPTPQTAIALAGNGRLWLVVVDGRQPGYSEGLTDRELAQFLIGIGVDTALRMDGGGSTTLVARGADGRPAVMNSPIHAGIPGWQRPVANHFGVYLAEADAVERKKK